MHQAFHHPSDVLRFAAAQARADVPLALAIVTDVTGGAMRGRGALMCVTGDEVVGYVSNGCVDADIIFQARALLEAKDMKRLRYGEGSPFQDITLPCGGRIDMLITSRVDDLNLDVISSELNARRSAELTVPKFQGDDFTVTYTPPLRLRIIGRGEAVRALARQSHSAGFAVVVQSPDTDIAAGLTLARFDHLTNPSSPPAIEDDAWTAVIVMFHDHDWEPSVLVQACRGPAFYIGAMGSPRTHDLRKATLKMHGLNPDDIARIHGPIGLTPSMRDANLLALSTLAEIVDCASRDGKL